MLSALAVPEQIHHEDHTSLLCPGHPHTLQFLFGFCIVMAVTDDNCRDFLAGSNRSIEIGRHWQIPMPLKNDIINPAPGMVQSASDHGGNRAQIL